MSQDARQPSAEIQRIPFPDELTELAAKFDATSKEIRKVSRELIQGQIKGLEKLADILRAYSAK